MTIQIACFKLYQGYRPKLQINTAERNKFDLRFLLQEAKGIVITLPSNGRKAIEVSRLRIGVRNEF